MDLSQLLRLSERYIIDVKSDLVPLPNLSVYQRISESAIEASIYDPVVCLILQGSKITAASEQQVQLRPGDALLVSHDLPVMSRITKASVSEPYIALILSLDLDIVRSLYSELNEMPPAPQKVTPLCVGPSDPAWVAPLTRYLGLMENSQDAKVLGPSILREIHYRLLLSPLGGTLRRLMVSDSHTSRVARAIQTIRNNFSSELSVQELARGAGMGVSSFHAHFKAVTRTTPLQFQKDLRLIEARLQLKEHGLTVSDTAFSVGYESPTHFSRDYSRKFGIPPSQDAKLSGTRI